MRKLIEKLNTKLAFEIIGCLASLIAIIAFFSTKPLPLLTINIVSAYEGDSDLFNPDLDYSISESDGYRCHLVSTDKNFSNFQDHLGTVIYVKMSISADGSSSEPDWVQASPEGCKLNFANLEDHGGLPRAPNGSSKFFSHYVGSEVNQEDDGETYSSIPEFILPLLPENGLEVDTCENHCFRMEGPVRIMKRSEGEGISSFLFEPVDTYKNSYLTSRYECRLAVERSGWAFFAPVYCSLF